MPIDNNWINSKDLIVAGEKILSDLKAETQKVKATLSDVNYSYSEMMRTINQSDEIQDKAILESQNKIYNLQQEIIKLRTKCNETIVSIDNNYNPPIAFLLEGYTPPG